MNDSKIDTKLVHFIIWLCYLTIFTVSLSDTTGINVAFFRASQLVLLQAILFYFNIFILMPRMLEKHKYVIYFSSLITIVIILLGILYLLNPQMKPFGGFVPQGIGKRADFPQKIMLSRAIMRNVSSLSAIILLSIVYRLFSQKIAKEKQEATLQNENLLSEMKFLKSQVNPHFLFNALNNIYTLVLLKHDKAPAMLMKLSEMLRYMLYECNDERVPLNKEISYINNYIELQQLKTEGQQNIKIDIFGMDHNILIPPLLLIPFIENSFKHSKIEDTETGWVSISLDCSEKQIDFKISNSIPSIVLVKDKTSGIGLENAKRRLELLYPQEYKLQINETPQEFSVRLTINL